jgi:hypothetical protein
MYRVGIAFTGGLNSLAAYVDAKIKGHKPILYFINHKDMNRGESEMIADTDHFGGKCLTELLKQRLQYFHMGNIWENHELRDHQVHHYLLSPTALFREHYSLARIYIGRDDPFLCTIPYIEPSPIAKTSNEFKRDLIMRELGPQMFDKWISYQVDHFAVNYEWKDYHTLEELQSWHGLNHGIEGGRRKRGR